MTPKQVIDEYLPWKHILGGMVISGGEPLVQHMEVYKLAQLCERERIPVALHTSGVPYLPLTLFFQKQILSALMIDFKAVPQRLGELGIKHSHFELGYHWCCEALKEGLLPELEVRTTVFKGLNDTESEIRVIASKVPDKARFVLQQGRNELAKVPDEWKNVNTGRMLELLAAARMVKPDTKLRALGYFG
jgi:pyruvate-formate lyase-activating enzyme